MNLVNYLIEATEEVFNTMIFMDITSEGCMTEGKEAIVSHFAAMIGLSGDMMAMINIHCTTYVALDIAGAMLDTEFDDINEEVRDALGEVANMIAGGLKSRLLDDGINVLLAIPTTITGTGYSISSPKRSNRVVIPFDLLQGQIFLDIKYTLNS